MMSLARFAFGAQMQQRLAKTPMVLPLRRSRLGQAVWSNLKGQTIKLQVKPQGLFIFPQIQD
jgi:hypothetical protein